MDETHIILLLAVLAVFVLAVAVVILLPKEKIAPSEEESKKSSKKKGVNTFKSKPRTQPTLPAAVKSQRIKGFDEVEEADDTRDLVDYLAKKDANPAVHVRSEKSEEKKKSKQPSTEGTFRL
jgi:hypothetical protein